MHVLSSWTIRQKLVQGIVAAALFGTVLSASRTEAATAQPVKIATGVVSPNTGDARYSVPIAVPPGPGGLQPKLSLAYSSSGGDGPFGVGWDLNFGARSVSCSQRFGIPDYSDCPRYELSGQLLTENPSIANRYHTMVESFARVLRDPTSGQWEVTLPNGMIQRYGTTPDARILAGSDTAEWLLSEIEDTSGNRIYFAYDDYGDAGQKYLVRITYGPNATFVAGKRQIVLEYEARPDEWNNYRGGFQREMTRRAKEIQVFGNGLIYQRHVLQYADGGYFQGWVEGENGWELVGEVLDNHPTVRSRLKSVQLFGTDCSPAIHPDPVSSCTGLPAQEFEYWSTYDEPSEDPGTTNISLDLDTVSYPDGITFFNLPKTNVVADITGDGQVEVISHDWGVGSTDTNSWEYSFASIQFERIGMQLDGPDPICGAQLVTSAPMPISGSSAYSDSPTAAFWGTTATPEVVAQPRIFIFDVDADGYTDVVVSSRVSGVVTHPGCDTNVTSFVEGATKSIVFRNTGDPTDGGGFVRDDSLASGMPPFGEVAFDSLSKAMGKAAPYAATSSSLLQCPARGLGGSAFYGSWHPNLCFNEIDFAPQFVDLNGDGYVDVLALQRLDPSSNSLWVGNTNYINIYDAADLSPLKTRAWIQDPSAVGGEPRWVRDNRWDLFPCESIVDCDEVGENWNLGPDIATTEEMGDWHASHVVNVMTFPVAHDWTVVPASIPSNSRGDAGVRFADFNRDGLTDVSYHLSRLWSVPYPYFPGHTIVDGDPPQIGLQENDPDYTAGPSYVWKGSLTNNGIGSPGVAGSAWVENNDLFAPPEPGYATVYSLWQPRPCQGCFHPGMATVPVGNLVELNGDGWPDYLEANYLGPRQEDVLATGRSRMYTASGWSDSSLSSGFVSSAENALCGVWPWCEFRNPAGTWTYKAWAYLDVNGDGLADEVGNDGTTLHASSHPDRLKRVKNGVGGTIDFTYETSVLQLDHSEGGLEELADIHAAATGTDEPVNGATTYRMDARPRSVVTSVSVAGFNFRGSGEDAAATTSFAYAHPRYEVNSRTPLGFRLREVETPSGATSRRYAYQNLGRNGRNSRFEVFDSSGLVFESEESWEIVDTAVPGTILHPDVHAGRKTQTSSHKVYASVAGATHTVDFTYDDVHGYNFAGSITETRPTGVLRSERTPVAVGPTHIVGNIAEIEQFDANVGGTLMSKASATYTYAGKLWTKTRYVRDRDDVGAMDSRTTTFAYDSLYGNLISETINVNGVDRTTHYCYDGDDATLGWCPGFAGQDTFSVRVGVKDALGNVATSTPHAPSGASISTTSDYTDVPGTRLELDPFGRVEKEFVLPAGAGGAEYQTAETIYYDIAEFPYVERLSFYTEGSTSDYIRTAVVSNGFGTPWKSVEETPSGYVGTANFYDAETQTMYSTGPRPCLDAGSTPGPDPLCEGIDVLPDNPAADVTLVQSDALGRMVRTDTPDGLSLARHFPVTRAQPAGSGSGSQFDATIIKNGKGDIVQKLFDADRVVWVDECVNPSNPGLSDLSATTTCAPPSPAEYQTFYTYEATGEVSTIYDPIAVHSDTFTDRNLYFRYRYDTLGRIIELQDPDYAGTASALTTYDEAGNVHTTTNARGQTATMLYDAIDRPISIDNDAGDDSYAFDYRPGELQAYQESSPQYVRTYTFDGYGRVAYSVLDARMSPGGPSTKTFRTDYEYDLTGRTTRLTHPDENTQISYEYEGAYLQRVCELNDASDCSASGGGSPKHYVENVSYNDLGQRETTQWPGGTRSFSFDPNTHRMTSDAFSGSGPTNFSYTRNYVNYDEVGNLTEISGSTTPGDVVIDESYEFDQRNRLVTWTRDPNGTSQQFDFDYDARGNLIEHAGKVQAYDDLDRPHAVKTRDDGAVSYSYDADGNVIAIFDPSAPKYFTYDVFNRLTCMGTTAGACDLNIFAYDVHGQRLIEYESGLYVYVDPSFTFIGSAGGNFINIEVMAFGERIVLKSVPNGYLRSAYIAPSWTIEWTINFAAIAGLLVAFLLAVRNGALVAVGRHPARAGLAVALAVTLVYPPAAWSGGGGGVPTYQWELSDQVGSGVVLLDEDGERVRHTRMTPFGKVDQTAGGSPATRHYFAGHRAHFDSGLVYMNARWYDPAAGRFLSVDPVISEYDDPQSINPYSYVGNNPVNRIDPTGESYSDIEVMKVVADMGDQPKRGETRSDSGFNSTSGQSLSLASAIKIMVTKGINKANFTIRAPNGSKQHGSLLEDDGQSGDSDASYSPRSDEEEQQRAGIGVARVVVIVIQGGRLLLKKLAERKLKQEATEQAKKKLVRGLQKQLDAHRQRLRAYRRNPYAFDNRGFLKNAPSQEVRERIIESRIRNLESQIRNFERQIQKKLAD